MALCNDLKVKAKIFERLAEFVDQLENEVNTYPNPETGEVAEYFQADYEALTTLIVYLRNYK